MARLSQLVDKELLEDRIREVILDYTASMVANRNETVMVDDLMDGGDTLVRSLVDEVYTVLSELDSEEVEDLGEDLTYDVEDGRG